MGIGISILLGAVGAVLAFAVHNVNTGGSVDIHTVGVILMAVAAAGVLLSLVFWSSWGGPRRGGGYVEGP